MMDTSSNKQEQKIRQHIPDEFLAAWKEKSMDELHALLEKAYKNRKACSTEKSIKHTNDVVNWLHAYIESRTLNDGKEGELDIFL